MEKNFKEIVLYYGRYNILDFIVINDISSIVTEFLVFYGLNGGK